MSSWVFANKRSTFGKKLIEHPVIRWKLAEMTRQAERQVYESMTC